MAESDVVTIRMTKTRERQFKMLEMITGQEGLTNLIDYTLMFTLSNLLMGRTDEEIDLMELAKKWAVLSQKVLETEDRGMDRQTFIDWFTGGETLARTISEQAARADIDMLSADNGHDVGAAEMARYIGWLREEGVVTD